MKLPSPNAVLAFLLAALPTCAAHAEAPRAVDYNFDIKPILSDRCYACHGPDSEQRQADLRLDEEEAAKEYVIVPGKPLESELYLRIAHEDPEQRMPPAKSKLELTDEEIELLRRWIEQGAEWKDHWAFTPPADVAVPQVSSSWPINEIDQFVVQRLEREGLRPQPLASRERLIRRLSFDLTGLPPTLEEIDRFLADQGVDAYERLVDRLLASKRYGERMAADWLDVARYSDTYGYQVDRDRFVWPWRDWVIRAFNDNMPYDEFVTQQLAGDLLPDAGKDETLATTFNRLHPQKVEGGSVPEEFRIEYVCDRTQTFGTALLGLTLECSRCHDHKFDPLKQREFYQLSAFFDNIDEAGLYSYFTESVPTPTLRLTDEAMSEKLAGLRSQLAEAERQVELGREGRRDAFAAWLPRRQSAGQQPPIPGRVALLDFEKHDDGANRQVPGRVGQAVQLTGDDGIGLDVGNSRRCDPFSVALWMNTPDEKERAVVFHRSRAWTDAGSRGYQLLIEDGCLSASLIHFWPGNAMRVRTRDKIPTGQWLHVAVTYDGSSRAAGLRIYVNGQVAGCEVVRDQLTKNITGGGGDNITIGERFRDRGFTRGLVDEFQVYQRQLTAIEVAQLHDGRSLVEAWSSSPQELSQQQRELLLDYYLATADKDQQQRLQTALKLREQLFATEDAIPEIMVMREPSWRRATFVLKRGDYRARGEPVEPGTPHVLPEFPDGAPRNRLGLARWLTRPDHPLTARVAVNRLWQQMFGAGLVRTPEDFGSQGQLPIHPELLDYLAQDFVAHGWDVKRMLKQIALSATYRQSSSASAELLARDPRNLLLARAPSYRWPAEMLRDNALAVSSLLVAQIGGPPARPYEVEASFKPTTRDKGPGLYRRSLYTYWKRTGPAPVMMTLDAAKRDVCQVRRERTSSPLQALVMLNGPQFVEAARVLSQNLLRQDDSPDTVLHDMFRMVTSRRPSDQELQVLRELYEQQLAYFQQHPERAEQYLAIGDSPVDKNIDAAQLAATTSVANTLLGYDDCVMKR